MGLIDQDNLTQNIVNRAAQIPNILRYYDFKVWLDGYTTCQHDILDIVRDAPTVDDWISVHERLPDKFKTVLFIGKNSYGQWYLAQRGFWSGKDWFSDILQSPIAENVSHWKSLPDPPKEN